MSFIKKIQNFSFHNKLFSKGSKIIIGISGGPDSVCLARIFLSLRNKCSLKLSLVHINYGLRGKDSMEDEEFVRNFANRYLLNLRVVEYKDSRDTENSENALRRFRYKELEKERKKKQYDLIAVGHTLDDQVETFLMNMMRGAGLEGLGAMRFCRGNIVRPLSAATKEEIIGHLGCIKQPYRIDKSNFDLKFTRNKVRAKLIPLIEKEFNPNFKKTIFCLTENIRRTNSVVDEYLETTYNRVIRKQKRGLSVDVSCLKELSDGVQALLFRKIIKYLKGDKNKLNSLHFFEFQKIIKSIKPKIQKCKFLGIVIEKRRDKITFTPQNDNL
ncbi:MAG: tRNA lysidine(34) synthetase TilS [Patescibacteria group bacterium]|nr:tRNA lysidine(34) synthetase TilS [Patescibacteria group bacterium]